jgi:putative cardiolipin synthase
MTRYGRWKTISAVAGAGIAAALVIRRANRLPPGEQATSTTPRAACVSRLAQDIMAQTTQHPSLSGLSLLKDGVDAFAARLLLVRAAEVRLDLQYYIWHGDRTGTLMLEALHAAADRGVQVRLLLDDNGIAGLDKVLSALDNHPNITVRLFNPFRIRFPKAIGYLVDFHRLNQRMHNKSFTADDAVSIIGGRNIGDEYFAAGDGALFADLDVLAIGPAVDEVVEDFERYWCSPSAYPATQILPKVGTGQLERLSARSSVIESDPSARRYVERLHNLPLIRQVADGTLPMEWAPVRLLSDDPAKVLGGVADHDLLAPRLEKALGTVERELGVIAGYFVPGAEGTAQLAALARKGKQVSILTNGYACNDVAVVHAGYAPWRRALLQAGVRLYEMRADEKPQMSGRERRRGTKLGVGSSLRGTGTGSGAALRSGASTLHAKTFTVDRERLFIGSFNFDPRSIRLNTELGFIIESPTLASEVADAFETIIPEHAFRVGLGEDGNMAWAREYSTEPLQTTEPGMGWKEHALIGLAKRLPIGWLL